MDKGYLSPSHPIHQVSIYIYIYISLYISISIPTSLSILSIGPCIYILQISAYSKVIQDAKCVEHSRRVRCISVEAFLNSFASEGNPENGLPYACTWEKSHILL